MLARSGLQALSLARATHGRGLCTPSAADAWRTIARATLVGYLGARPVLNTWESGRRTLSLNLATRLNEPNGAGGFRNRTQWLRVYVRDDLPGFDFVSGLEKGAVLYVEGNLRNVVRHDIEGRETTYTNVSVAPREGGLVRVLRGGSVKGEEDGEAAM